MLSVVVHTHIGQWVNGEAKVQAVVEAVKLADHFVRHAKILSVLKYSSPGSCDLSKIFILVGHLVFRFGFLGLYQELCT